jgi:2,4-didehydro-3-deoxy-L-rhamnonate hydrolase
MTCKLGTFSVAGCTPFPGLVVGERVLSLRSVAEYLALSRRQMVEYHSLRSLLKNWEHEWPLLNEVAEALNNGRAPELADRSASVETLIVHAPLPEPRHVYCSGANYKKHVVQLIMAGAGDETNGMSEEERRQFGERKMDERARNGTPFFFIKALSAVTGPFDPVVLPDDATQPDWELELAVVMGRTARRVSRERALDYVAGYTIANDITRRERVNRRPGDSREMGMDWVAAKSAPTFLPLGPYLVPAAFVGDPQSLRITLKLNGEVMQDESTSDMIFGVARLIENLSTLVELQPGDVICTGSPAGNGAHYRRFLKAGDVLEGSISGLGNQINMCRDES